MKKIIYIMVFTFVLFFPINVYAAECSNARLNELKEIAKSVEVTYDVDLSSVFGDEVKEFKYDVDGNEIERGNIEIDVVGVLEGFYIIDKKYNRRFEYSDTVNGTLILHNEKSGNINLDIYSNECDNKSLRSIHLRIPKYNPYSSDPECAKIEGDKPAFCNKWYDDELDYDTFQDKIDDYNVNQEKLKKEMAWKNSIIYKAYSFIKTNILYILGGILF